MVTTCDWPLCKWQNVRQRFQCLPLQVQLCSKRNRGNLSENLEKVGKVLRQRFKLTRKIKTLSAESRLSAWILVLSPFVLFIGLMFINPDYVTPLYQDARGMEMVSVGMVSLFFGAIWIRKIISFEV